MTDFHKKRFVVVFAIFSLVLGAYIVGYFRVRRRRLSFNYMASRMVFDSNEQARQWGDGFHAKPDTRSLAYDDNVFLYVLFWPAINIDSAISGREIDSPFGIRPYAIPRTNESSQQSPGGDSLKAAPQE